MPIAIPIPKSRSKNGSPETLNNGLGIIANQPRPY